MIEMTDDRVHGRCTRMMMTRDTIDHHMETINSKVKVKKVKRRITEKETRK